MGASADQKSYNKTLLSIQKSANNSAKTIQQLVNKSNTQQMEYNKKEAATARTWEKMMSDTSHQREVSDLKKAGLNPVLSVNNGAQSYTTSAASTSNDSGASAASNIYQGQLGAIASLESSRMSAQAQLKAAQQSAAAMRYSAQQSAAAQRYAAQQAAAASMYHSDVQNEMNKRSTEAQKWIATNKQPGGLFGFIDKQLTATGGNKLIKSLAKKFQSTFQAAYKSPGNFFKNKGAITQSNFKLNKYGQDMFNAVVAKAGLKVNQANRRMAVRAFVFQDAASLRQFNKMANSARSKKVQSYHHQAVTVSRRGHR